MHDYMSPESRVPTRFNFQCGIGASRAFAFIKSVSDKVATNKIRFHAVRALAFFCGPIPGAWIWLVGHKTANAPVNQKEVGAVDSFEWSRSLHADIKEQKWDT